MGIIGTYEGYVSDPLYLRNGNSWGAGQSSVSILTKSVSSNTSFDTSGGFNAYNMYGDGYLFRFDHVQNLSGWNYLKIRGTIDQASGGIIGVGVSSNSTISVLYKSDASKSISVSSGNYSTAILDVSSISGSRYIFLEILSNKGYTAGRITHVYLSNS